MSDYSFMRTGIGGLADPSGTQWSPEDWKVAQAALVVFTEDSMVMAKKYASMRGHEEASAQDIMHCLKTKTREGLATSPNVQERMQEYSQMLEQDQMDEEYSLEEDYSGAAEDLLDTLDPPADTASADPSFVSRVQEAVNTWDDWEPQNDIDRILKEAVNNTARAFQ